MSDEEPVLDVRLSGKLQSQAGRAKMDGHPVAATVESTSGRRKRAPIRQATVNWPLRRSGERVVLDRRKHCAPVITIVSGESITLDRRHALVDELRGCSEKTGRSMASLAAEAIEILLIRYRSRHNDGREFDRTAAGIRERRR